MLEIFDKIIKQLQVPDITYKGVAMGEVGMTGLSGPVRTGYMGEYDVILNIYNKKYGTFTIRNMYTSKTKYLSEKYGFKARLNPDKMEIEMIVMHMKIEISKQRSIVRIINTLLGNTTEFELSDPTSLQQIKDHILKFSDDFKKVYILP